MALMPSPWVILAAVALLSGSYAYGRHGGVAATEARYVAAQQALQRDLFRAAELASAASAKLETYRADQAALARRAEDEARADVDPCRVPAAGSLRRLETRWRATNPGP